MQFLNGVEAEEIALPSHCHQIGANIFQIEGVQDKNNRTK